MLLLSDHSEPDDLRTCLHWRLMPTLSRLRVAQLCNALAADSGRSFNVQLKIDTGMARLGCSLKESHQTATELQSLQHLNLEGIYSHLACADEPNDALTSLQQARFVSMLSTLPQASAGITRHLANSAGTLLNRELHHDLVRWVGPVRPYPRQSSEQRRSPATCSGGSRPDQPDPRSARGYRSQLRPSLHRPASHSPCGGWHRLCRWCSSVPKRTHSRHTSKSPAASGGSHHHGPAPTGCHRCN